jgi:hypothetical protein
LNRLRSPIPASTLRHNLPASLGHLLETKESGRARQLLARTSRNTTGSGGVGKMRLLLQVAEAVLPIFAMGYGCGTGAR